MSLYNPCFATDHDATVWDEEQAIILLQLGKCSISQCPLSLRNNPRVAMASSKHNPMGILHIDTLRQDKSVVIEFVKRCGMCLHYVSDELYSDSDIISKAVKNAGKSLVCASDALRNNREIVMLAVKNAGKAIQHASEELRDDKEIVMLALKNDHQSLKYASNRLQIDDDVLESRKKYAIKQKYHWLKYHGPSTFAPFDRKKFD